MAPDHAFDRLYRRHARDVYRFAYGLVRNRADAEDVAQTAFLNAYRALERGHRPESPRNWLLAIAQNVHRQRLRRAQRRVQEVALDVELAEAIAVEEESALEPTDVRRALRSLAPNQRAALVLRELEGQTYAEIAESLEVSVGAVETLIFRARRALREQLETTLTCSDAERLIAAGDRSRRLRAHLRECAACRTVARSARARRSPLRSLFGLPWFGGGGSGAVAAKVATVVIATGTIAGGLTQLLGPAAKPQPAVPARQAVAATAIEAAFAVSEAPGRRARAATKRAGRPRPAQTTTVAQPVNAAPHPGAVAAPPATHPSTPPVAAPMPAATPSAQPNATTTTATTTVTTTSTSTVATATVAVETPALPAVPPVTATATVTATAPSLPPAQPADLTQSSQNLDASISGIGHLYP